MLDLGLDDDRRVLFWARFRDKTPQLKDVPENMGSHLGEAVDAPRKGATSDGRSLRFMIGSFEDMWFFFM